MAQYMGPSIDIISCGSFTQGTFYFNKKNNVFIHKCFL